MPAAFACARSACARVVRADHPHERGARAEHREVVRDGARAAEAPLVGLDRSTWIGASGLMRSTTPVT